MSTRSMIAVQDRWNCPMRLFYRHCDGYPTGLGEELIEEMKKTRNVSDVLKAVCARDEQKYVSKVSEIYPGTQGDLEWIYVIDVENWSLSIIKCSNPYCKKRFNWLAWFSYARYFPRNYRQEMHMVETEGCHILRALAAFESNKEVFV